MRLTALMQSHSISPLRTNPNPSAKNDAPRFLRKMLINLGGDLRVGHFIGCFHTHPAVAGIFMLQPFAEFPFGFAGSKNQQRRSLLHQSDHLVIISVELVGKFPVQHIIRLGSLRGMTMS